MAIIQFKQMDSTSMIHQAINDFLAAPSVAGYNKAIDAMRGYDFLVPYIATKNLDKLDRVKQLDIAEFGGGPDTILTEQNEVAIPIFCKDRLEEINSSDILQNNTIIEMKFEIIYDIVKRFSDKIQLIIVNPFSDNFPVDPHFNDDCTGEQ